MGDDEKWKDAVSADARRAPDGHVWRCCACGKWAEDRYGLIGPHSPGWDESCMLNAVATDAHPPWVTEV